MRGLPAGLGNGLETSVSKDYSDRIIDSGLLGSFVTDSSIDTPLEAQIAAFTRFLLSDQAAPTFSANYAQLGKLDEKRIWFDGTEEYLQFNAKRARNIEDFLVTAAVRTNCFLCPEEMPKGEVGIPYLGRMILGNLYPYLDSHLVVVETSHAPQQLGSQLPAMLQFAKESPGMFYFYNGPLVGASAPDHPHFQGGRKNNIPLLRTLAERHLSDSDSRIALDLDLNPKKVETYIPTNVGRSPLVVRAFESEDVQAGITNAVEFLTDMTDAGFIDINFVVTSIHQAVTALIIPRTSFRYPGFELRHTPKFTPASCEFLGRWPVPVRTDYDTVSAKQLREIIAQVSVSEAELVHHAGRYAMARP